MTFANRLLDGGNTTLDTLLVVPTSSRFAGSLFRTQWVRSKRIWKLKLRRISRTCFKILTSVSDFDAHLLNFVVIFNFVIIL